MFTQNLTTAKFTLMKKIKFTPSLHHDFDRSKRSKFAISLHKVTTAGTACKPNVSLFFVHHRDTTPKLETTIPRQPNIRLRPAKEQIL